MKKGIKEKIKLWIDIIRFIREEQKTGRKTTTLERFLNKERRVR